MTGRGAAAPGAAAPGPPSSSPASPGLAESDLPIHKPRYLRTSTIKDFECWRFDAHAPGEWSWEPFPTARYRFDSAAGAVRVRYAGLTARGAARERWDPDRRIAAADGQAWVTRLKGTARVVDLRRETILDQLGLDDRISTARDVQTWHTCQALGDRLRTWLPGLEAIVYRSRTTPETSANIVWHDAACLKVEGAARLADCGDLLDRLVLADGFTVDFQW